MSDLDALGGFDQIIQEQEATKMASLAQATIIHYIQTAEILGVTPDKAILSLSISLEAFIMKAFNREMQQVIHAGVMQVRKVTTKDLQ